MAIDTPAKLVVVGGGPIGIETTLYARFLGYDVEVLERDRLFEHVLACPGDSLVGPFGKLTSPLGKAAIRTQLPEHRFPEDGQVVSVRQWLETYLLPLAEVDLVVDSIRCGWEMLQVGRESYRRSDRVEYEDRFDELFLCRAVDSERNSRWISADIVVDATGMFGTAAGMGPGGLDPLGNQGWKTEWRDERVAAEGGPRLIRRFLAAAGKSAQVANRRVVVLGNGATALTNLAALLQVPAEERWSSLEWWTRSPVSAAEASTSKTSDSSWLVSLREQVERGITEGRITRRGDVQISRLEAEGESWKLELMGETAEELAVDVLIANTGFVGDDRPFAELQVARCPISGVPLSPQDPEALEPIYRPLAVDSWDAADLVTTEPNFYVLGAKRWGRGGGCSMERALGQIRSLFTLIADSPRLDLYANPPG